MKIQFGFEDITYAQTRNKKGQFQKRTSSGKVAEKLEDEYLIVESFYNLDAEQMLIPMLEDAFAESLNFTFKGTPYPPKLKDTDPVAIRDKFRHNLTNRRYDGLLFNTPTIPSQKTGRPSFVNTGTYRNSFRVWEE